jgi:hypothetical protein
LRVSFSLIGSGFAYPQRRVLSRLRLLPTIAAAALLGRCDSATSAERHQSGRQVHCVHVAARELHRKANRLGKFHSRSSNFRSLIAFSPTQILSCPSETERQRWLQATAPPTSENPHETLYEQWDCPQVVVKHAYQPLEPDELCLDTGDVVNVLKKMKDDGELSDLPLA